MSTNLYGIKNCDTVKKARKWLEDQAVPYTFHDFRADGISAKEIQAWEKHVGKDALINKRSTTWKQLTQDQQDAFADNSLSKAALSLILENPTLIKRPVLVHEGKATVGFNANIYNEFLN